MARNEHRKIRSKPKPGRNSPGSGPATKRDPVRHTLECVERLMAYLDTPVALSTVILIRHQQWRELSERGIKSLRMDGYRSADAFRKDYLAVTILSKNEFLETGIDRREVALLGFRQSEEKCAQTNIRLSREGSIPDPIWQAIRLARKKISRLLGAFDWNECAAGFGFGPGATTRVPRRDSCFTTKVCGNLHTTFDNLPVVRVILERKPSWALARADNGNRILDNVLTIVKGNEVTTVSKNAKTDRVIAVEPDLNIYAQKGIGEMLRRRLKTVGCDTRDQGPNQVLARIGSEDGSLATIDLSAASDTISKSIVELLIPGDWYSAMDLTRSHWGSLEGGSPFLYRKFSTMGNGFTFELETLIFWALSSAVIDLAGVPLRTLRVYGDDVIVPASCYERVCDVFAFAGFTVNSDKSFHSGAFRESCGKHYWFGDDVTPFYVKKPLKGAHRAFWWVNAIRRWTTRDVAGAVYCDQNYRALWESELLRLPKRWRQFRVPSGAYEESGIVSPRSDAIVGFSRRRAQLSFPILQRLEVRRKVECDPSDFIYSAQLSREWYPGKYDLEPRFATWFLGQKDESEEIPVRAVLNEVTTDDVVIRPGVGFVIRWQDPGDWM